MTGNSTKHPFSHPKLDFGGTSFGYVWETYHRTDLDVRTTDGFVSSNRKFRAIKLYKRFNGARDIEQRAISLASS